MGEHFPFSAFSALSAYRVTVTIADALLPGSAADVALTLTVAGDGTRRGAV